MHLPAAPLLADLALEARAVVRASFCNAVLRRQVIQVLGSGADHVHPAFSFEANECATRAGAQGTSPPGLLAGLRAAPAVPRSVRQPVDHVARLVRCNVADIAKDDSVADVRVGLGRQADAANLIFYGDPGRRLGIVRKQIDRMSFPLLLLLRAISPEAPADMLAFLSLKELCSLLSLCENAQFRNFGLHERHQEIDLCMRRHQTRVAAKTAELSEAEDGLNLSLIKVPIHEQLKWALRQVRSSQQLLGA
eukprot:scaffold1954_cov268-Pinguiococcus_pyrenoidosus.AAC.7